MLLLEVIALSSLVCQETCAITRHLVVQQVHTVHQADFHSSALMQGMQSADMHAEKPRTCLSPRSSAPSTMARLPPTPLRCNGSTGYLMACRCILNSLGTATLTPPSLRQGVCTLPRVFCAWWHRHEGRFANGRVARQWSKANPTSPSYCGIHSTLYCTLSGCLPRLSSVVYCCSSVLLRCSLLAAVGCRGCGFQSVLRTFILFWRSYTGRNLFAFMADVSVALWLRLPTMNHICASYSDSYPPCAQPAACQSLRSNRNLSLAKIAKTQDSSQRERAG